MGNPFRTLSRKECILLIVSLVTVSLSTLASEEFSILTLAAALIGVTAVMLGAKGNVWGQILIAVFSILYGIISLEFHYFGEMISYLGMAFPMAVWSVFTWLKHPSEGNREEVEVGTLSKNRIFLIALLTVLVTILFWFLLDAFETPNLIFSTISIGTSFLAAALTMLRSAYYAFWYAMNDLVLIVLWVLAAWKEPRYLAVVVNFCVFLVNDSYGFYSWKKRKREQKK